VQHRFPHIRLSLGRSLAMADSIRPRSLGAVAVLALLVAGPACVVIGGDQARYVEREDKRFAVTGKPDVSLSTFDGPIEIRVSDRPEVLVTIEKRAWNKKAAAGMDVRTEQNGNHIVVDVRLPKAAHVFAFGFSSASAKLIVTMPASADVHASSGDGSIDVERINGVLNLRSGDGSIHGRDLAGDLTLHTGDGSIKLEKITGALDVDTGDGSITADGTFKSVRVRSGDGGVTIRAAAGSATDADWSITTGDGSVVLDVPDSFGGELDAHTGDGAITMRDVTLSNVSGPIGKSSVRGRLGAGGHAVKVRTGDGSITLRRY
jgi:DUF4097 and DUF4098 domain-containing protein YvlB